MFYKSICWLVCTLVAVATATGCSGQESNTESSVAEPVQEVRRDPAVELGWLLDAGEGAAVTLVSGDTRLLAHRAVLAARSPVFQRILQDAATGEVALQDVEGPVLRRLLTYLYTLQAPQLPAMAPQLLAGAHQYGLPALKADCERQVAAQLTVQTAAATAALAVRYSSDSLKRAAIDYIRDHIFDVMATQGWADALRIQPEVMIQVTQLLSQSPAETSTTTTADSGPSPYTATQPHRSHSSMQSPATGAPTMAAQTVPQTVDDRISLLRSTTPADSGPSPYAATQPHSSHSSTQTPATAAPTMAAQTVPQTDDDRIYILHTTTPADSGPSPHAATQPHSSHTNRQSLATAAPTMAGQTVPQTDDDYISVLRRLSPEEKGRRLIEAAGQGEVGQLEALLAAGADVGARSGYWNGTTLHWAASNGREEAARRLLAAGAAVDGRDSWQETPLHDAARNGRAAVVRLLLAANADHGARNIYGWTPLHVAAVNGHTEAADALVGAGADRTARDDWGRTPLDLAREYSYQQVVQLLEGNTSITATT